MLDNYLQQTTSADDVFRCIFFLGALRVKIHKATSENFRVSTFESRAGNLLIGSNHMTQFEAPRCDIVLMYV